MKCSICEREDLLHTLQLKPADQQLRKQLLSLLHCEGTFIASGVNFNDPGLKFCRKHKQWINYEQFVRKLNRPEIKTLLFGESTIMH